jgi:serine/threonine-protein kinase
VDGRTDQYALACTAFEMLAGEAPFLRDQELAVIWAHLSQPPPSLTARRPDLPAAVNQVFDRALAKSQGDRYASCQEFAEALRQALGLDPYAAGHGGAANVITAPICTITGNQPSAVCSSSTISGLEASL